MSQAVLIVGAGATGLTLAIDLARRGVPYRIVDRADGPLPGSRGKGLQPRTLEVFDDLGVLDAVLAQGSGYPPLRAWQGEQVVWEGHMTPTREVTPDVPHPNPWLLPQMRTERILRERLAALGGDVEQGTELVGLAQDAGGVTATLRRAGNTEQARFDYLVGADGGHSAVRKAIGVGFLGESRPAERMLVGDLPVPGLDREHWHFWGGSPADGIGLCPLAGTDLFQLQASLLDGDDPEPTTADVHALFGRRAGVDLPLGDVVWASRWRANIRMADRFRAGRVFLTGDAAHVHSPAGGQGLNTGVQDAYNLGWKLAAVLAGAPEELLDTYQAERLPVAAGVLGISTELHDRAVRGDRDAHSRDDPELRQLLLSYPDSPLSVEARTEPTGVRAGDRAPDAPCRRADGTPVRLFDVFRGPQITVLAFGSEASPTLDGLVRGRQGVRLCQVTHPGRRADGLVDQDGHAHGSYGGADGTIAVVRPDGYLGLVTTDPDQVPGYLRAVS
ncbi:MAG: FAD-dependent oxidoreductase [Actinocatenispora sp.]